MILRKTVKRAVVLLQRPQLTRKEVIETVDGLLDALRPIVQYWSQLRAGAPFCQVEAAKLAKPFVEIARLSAVAIQGTMMVSLENNNFAPDYVLRRIENMVKTIVPTADEHAGGSPHMFVEFMTKLIRGTTSNTPECDGCGRPLDAQYACESCDAVAV